MQMHGARDSLRGDGMGMGWDSGLKNKNDRDMQWSLLCAMLIDCARATRLVRARTPLRLFGTFRLLGVYKSNTSTKRAGVLRPSSFSAFALLTSSH
jgi:hypothetical protein